jgi:hypothetical protein
MDAVAIGVVLGLLGTTAYAVIRALRQRSFDLGGMVLTFVGLFSLPGAVVLIRAGFTGNLADLPDLWREHIVVAGVVVIGLTMQFLAVSFLDVWSKKAATDRKGEEK